MFNKLILSVFAVSSLFSGAVNASEKEPFIGKITYGQAKRFMEGFVVGVAHGAVNQGLSKAGIEDHMTLPAWTATYAASHGATKAYTGKELKADDATSWGHGLGQCLGESIGFKKENEKLSLKFNPQECINLTLIWAAYATNESLQKK